MTTRPDLIVPPYDRRRRKRILTIKNFGIAGGVLLTVFAAITIRSEMRDSSPDTYGSLYERQVPKEVAVSAKRVEVVKEGPSIDDQSHADPMLLSSAAREQVLIAGGSATPALVPTAEPSAGETFAPVRKGEGDVAIVGGPEGVTLVKTSTQARPKLSGGIFKASVQ